MMISKNFIPRCAFGFAILILLIHTAMFLQFTIDDAYITFTYTKHLIEGKGLVFATGQYVEATSSMLWVFLLIPFEAIFKDGAVIGSKVLGMLCLLGTATVGSLLIRELLTSKRNLSLACLSYVFLLAGTSPFVVWSVYGLEHGLVALILCSSILLFIKEFRNGHGRASSLIIFLLVVVRPEGYIYLPVFIGFRLLLVKNSGGRSLIRWFGLWFAILSSCLICYEVFGLAYFGHFMPNTVAAKVSGISSGLIWQGIEYLKSDVGLFYTSILLLSILLAMFRIGISYFMKSINRVSELFYKEMPVLVISACLIVHWSFVIFVGGDWMPNIRFLSQAIPLLLVLFIVSIWQAFKLFSPFQSLLTQTALIWVVSLSFLGFYLMANIYFSKKSYVVQAKLNKAEDRIKSDMIAQLNLLAQKESAVVACSDVGRMGYYFKGNVLDWWGLADEEIAQLGQAQGNVDPVIILRRRPEFIILYSNEPQLTPSSMRSGMAVYSRKFFKNQDFLSKYRQIYSVHFWADRWHVLFEKIPDKPD